MEHLQYPVGRFETKSEYSEDELLAYQETIRAFPEKLMSELKDLDKKYYNKTYRPGGWTLMQVVHHLADSHINAYVRFKRALTENEPEVHGYLEKKWAELADGKSNNLFPSLMLLQGIHSRWHSLLEAMKPEDFQKKYYHLGNESMFSLSEGLANYDWHCRHHFAHIRIITQSEI